MELEYETKSAYRIMTGLLSDDTGHIVDTILRDELTAASCSSFNTKSTIASSFKEYETAASASAIILKYTKMCNDIRR